MVIIERIPTVVEYTALREAVGWWNIDQIAAVTALKSSLYSVVAVEQNAVIGCGRICGDGGLYYYIQDLIVHPDYQRQGVGKKIMGKLMEYLSFNSTGGSCIALMAAEGLAKFYEEFGFKVRPANGPGMYLIN